MSSKAFCFPSFDWVAHALQSVKSVWTAIWMIWDLRLPPFPSFLKIACCFNHDECIMYVWSTGVCVCVVWYLFYIGVIFEIDRGAVRIYTTGIYFSGVKKKKAVWELWGFREGADSFAVQCKT